MTADSLRIPTTMLDRARAIIEVTDAACEEHLDAEYGRLAQRLIARLARNRPSPLARDDVRIWAAGVIHALGQVNFLFDRTQTPHLTADELAERLGVVKTTMANKAGLINCFASGSSSPRSRTSRCSSNIRWRGWSRSTASSSMHAACPQTCRARRDAAA